MRGEKLQWHFVATHLKKSVQEAQNSMTSSEFVDMLTFIEMDWSFAKPDHYYLARIAREIKAIFAKDPSSLKLEDFLLKFTAPEKDKDENEAKDKLQKSKSTWASFLGAFARKKKRP